MARKRNKASVRDIWDTILRFDSEGNTGSFRLIEIAVPEVYFERPFDTVARKIFQLWIDLNRIRFGCPGLRGNDVYALSVS